MGILEKEILVTLTSSNIKHYEDKNYEIPRRKDHWGNFGTPKGTKILVKVVDLPSNSHIRLTKICDICGMKIPNQRYQDILKCIRNNKDCCKECRHTLIAESRRKNVRYEKSLEFYAKNNNPCLLEEFDKSNTKKPREISYGSKDEYLWKCKKCKSTYSSSVNNKTKGDTGCPFCKGVKVNHTNCLWTTHPKICVQWHKTLNGDFTPYDITSGSSIKVWWICEKGHEWEATVNNRVNNEQSCPYCEGSRASIETCLSTLYPDLSKQWHPSKNGELTPFDVTIGSNRKVWWLGECGHEWEMKIRNRTIQGSGCLECNESKGEKKLREIFSAKGIQITSQYEFKNLLGIGGRNLKFDFAVFDESDKLVFLVEYDGEFHFEKLYEGDGHEIIVVHDQRKNKYCQKSKIPLVRIPYWEFDNIDFILNLFLSYFKLSETSNENEDLISKYLVNHSNWIYDEYINSYKTNYINTII
jgi:hypothetical protein